MTPNPEGAELPPTAWKCGNEFLPYHPSASHVNPDHRDGWNACYAAALTAVSKITAERDALREALVKIPAIEARADDLRGSGMVDWSDLKAMRAMANIARAALKETPNA